MLSRTIYLSRLIGLYFVLVPPCLAIHKELTIDSLTALLHDQPVMLMMSIITVIAGLAMILAHNLWFGGMLPVVVTLVGWLTFVEGMVFLVLPYGVEAETILGWLRSPILFYLWLTPCFFIGIYLTLEGFRQRARS